MTLKDYYDKLERPTPPKKEFIKKISERCHVDPYTVRLWIAGKSKPSKDEYMEILADETGIDIKELFDND